MVCSDTSLHGCCLDMLCSFHARHWDCLQSALHGRGSEPPLQEPPATGGLSRGPGRLDFSQGVGLRAVGRTTGGRSVCVCVCVYVCVFVRVWVVAVTSSICFPMLCERDEFRLGSCCSQSLCAVPPDGGAICLSRAGPPLHFLQTVVPFARHGLPHVCLIASYQQTYCPCANGDVACAGYPPTWFHSTNSIIHCGQYLAPHRASTH